MTPNETVYNVKKFLLPESGNSCALYHAKIYEDDEYYFRIHDCHSGIRLRGNLSSDIGKKEAIEKIETLINGLSQFKEFIESEYTILDEDIDNYIPKGHIKGFPIEIIKKMLDEQENQGNKRNIAIFEENRWAGVADKGFDHSLTKEGAEFWENVIALEDFEIFFEKYPKQIDKED